MAELSNDAIISQVMEDLEMQSADFLWIDFFGSADVAAQVGPHSKLRQIIQGSKAALSDAGASKPVGFDWIEPPRAFRSAIESARRELMNAASGDARRRVVMSFLNDPDPPFLRHLRQV